MKKLFISGLLTASALLVAACGNQQEQTEVSIGVVGDQATQIWESVADRLAEEGEIKLEVVTFTDYVQPNRSLEDGETDLNAFQHVAFLLDHVKQNDSSIVPIGYTFISPMGLYAAEGIDDVAQIPDGATIALPNDPTNGGRAYLLLEAAGLIEVDDTAGYTPNSGDVTANPHNFKFEELDAAQVPRALGDAEAVISNTNYAVDAGWTPREDAIYIDTDHMDKVNEVYKNVIATQKDNADSEVYAKIVEEYQQSETAELLAEISNNADTPVWSENETPLADFEKLLTD